MSIQRSNRNHKLSLTKPILNLSLALTVVGALFWANQLAAQPSESETDQILFLKEEEVTGWLEELGFSGIQIRHFHSFFTLMVDERLMCLNPVPQ